jgi:hypothetical protein
MITKSFHYVSCAALALALGCGGGPGSVSTTISAMNGGSVELDGSRLDIPAAALAADTEISMRLDAFPATPALELAHDEVLVIEPGLTELALPAALTLALADITPDDDVDAYQLIDGGWSRLAAEVGSDGVVHTSVTGLGTFAVVIRPRLEGGNQIVGTLKWPDGTPAGDVPVALHRDGSPLTEDMTDPAGGFGFVDLSPGTYHVVITFECSLDKAVTVTATEPTTVDLVLCGSN